MTLYLKFQPIFCVLCSCLTNYAYFCEELKLTLLHHSKLNARYKEFDYRDDECYLNQGDCYGGFARISFVTNQEKITAASEGRYVIVLNTGDTYSGTTWFYVHNISIALSLIPLLEIDAAALGYHEFDYNGTEGLKEFIEGVNFPIIAANVQSRTSLNLKGSTIIVRGGYKIGIIGFLSNYVKYMGIIPDDIFILNVVSSINHEVELLIGQNTDIKTIIVVGYGSLQEYQEIAILCPKVNIIIGGYDSDESVNLHKNYYKTPERNSYFLWAKDNNRRVPIVRTRGFTKYIGRLYINIDTETGSFTSLQGEEIFLSSIFSENMHLIRHLKKFEPQMKTFLKQTVAVTVVNLGEGSECRKQECNFGNLVTDALVDFGVKLFKNKSKVKHENMWTDTPLSIVSASTIELIGKLKAYQNISMHYLLKSRNFQENVVKVCMLGEDLKKFIVCFAENPREFIQVSGIRLYYDKYRPVNHRLQYVRVLCRKCLNPYYEDLELNCTYYILTTNVLIRDNECFPKNLKHTYLADFFDVVAFYLKNKKFVYPEIEGRIIISCAELKRTYLFIYMFPYLGLFFIGRLTYSN